MHFKLVTSDSPDTYSGGSTGAIIPYIEKAFGIGYIQVSLLFMCTFVGYVVAALVAGPLSRRVGFGHALAISVIVELAGVCADSWLSISY